MTQVDSVSFTPMKNVIITITDCETGEIYGYTRKNLPDDGVSIKKLSKTWFDSFLRGFEVHPFLSVNITVRPEVKEEKLFNLDSLVHKENIF